MRQILHNVFHKLKNRSSSSPDSLQSEDSLSPDADVQAKIFADYFSEESGHEPIPFTINSKDSNQHDCPFTLIYLKLVIRRTRILPACEDKISVALFKGLNDHFLVCLLQIFDNIWHSGTSRQSGLLQLFYQF